MLSLIIRYGISSFVYRARRPFNLTKLYQLLEGKFILLQDEADDESEGEAEGSDSGTSSNQRSASPTNSDKTSEGSHSSEKIEDAQILANRKASPFFSGLHRSKGVFWHATRPYQIVSWSTAGVMLTIGSKMPWYCCMSQDDWGADGDTINAIKSDFEGAWGDRRQEVVFIGERMDVDGLAQQLNACLLDCTEMGKWEVIMHDQVLDWVATEEKLAELWDDGYWSEWLREEAEQGHRHSHSM